MLPLLLLLPLLAQTTDYNSAINTTMAIVIQILPLMIILIVLRMLFTSFRDISKTKMVRYAKQLMLLLLLGQTLDTWNTNIDIWGTITGIVLMTLPFLVLIIVLRSIFRAFKQDW